MSDAPRNLGLKLTIALLALLAAGKPIFYDTLDPDCFWHLRVAEQLQHDGVGPLVDHLSFASMKTPWTPYSWLAELGMKKLWDLGGWRAAIAAQSFITGAFVMLIAMCAWEGAQLFSRDATRRAISSDARRMASRLSDEEQNPLAIILSTIFAMYLSLLFLSFRPVTFVIVLLTLCAWLLLRDRRLQEKSFAVWLVIPLAVLMTNCHFFAVLLPMWVCALLIGAIWERKNILRYTVMFLATALACLATPMLPGVIHSVWSYQFSDPMVGGGIVAEFQPVWAGGLFSVTMILLFVWFICVFYNRHRFRLGEWIWMFIATALLLRMGRFAPLFAPIAAATLAASLPPMSGKVLARPAICGLLGCILMVGIVRLIAMFPDSQTSLSAWLNRHGPDTPGYPCEAADFVAQRISSGRIINEFSWGGYLSWRLGDRYQVLLDGRTQVYSPAFWRTIYFGSTEQSKPLLASSGARAAVLPMRGSRFRAQLMAMGWQSAFHDERAEVLLPPTAQANGF